MYISFSLSEAQSSRSLQLHLVLGKSVKKLETMEIIEAVEQSGEDTTPIAFGDDEPEAESPPADADPVAEAPAADEGLDATPIKWDD